MKVLSAIVLACIGYSLAASDALTKPAEVQGLVDDFINTTLNNFLSGIDDPLTVESSYEKYNNVILTGWVNVTDLELKGVQSIVASYIDVEFKLTPPSSINLTIDIKDINLFFNYEAALIIGQILPFSGKGNISANLDSFSVSLYTLANVDLIPIGISGFQNSTIKFSVGENTYLHFEGLYNNGNITKSVNDVIDEYLPRIIDFIDTNEETISAVLSPVLQALLDRIFSTSNTAN